MSLEDESLPPAAWQWRVPDYAALLVPLETAVALGTADFAFAEEIYIVRLADCTEADVLARAGDIFEALRDGRPVPPPDMSRLLMQRRREYRAEHRAARPHHARLTF